MMKLSSCLKRLTMPVLLLSLAAIYPRPSFADLHSDNNQFFWPGTETRYYPGIYPAYTERGTNNFSSFNVQRYWSAWFEGRENDYREFVGDTPVTHLGVSIFVDPSLFFTEYWRNSPVQPYDWKGACRRISAAQDPDAAPNGQPLYDWSRWDELLNQRFVAEKGGKVILKIQQGYTNATNSRSPLWMRNEGYIAAPDANGWNSNWWHSQMQDWAAVYMWQDIMAAFATRYKGDSRIASLNMDEVYPSLYRNRTMCGLVHDLPAAQAANAGLIEVMKAYLDIDPGMLWAMVNWHPANYSDSRSSVTIWENGYGGRSIGVNSLPGVQGHWIQDMRFFGGNIGSGSPGTIDSDDSSGLNRYLSQYYGVNRKAPVFVSSEAHGWSLSARNYRTGNANPWGVNIWPDQNRGGVLPNDDGKLFPSARFWAWYTSGTPRAVGSNADSGLGQAGSDPAGVMPANFYTMFVPTWFREDRPAWNSANLSIQSWLDAFDTFGPRGTKAMFNHPDGYLEQFSNTESSNRSPVARDDSATTEQDRAVTIDVLANDSDPDGDDLSIQSFGQGENGTVRGNGGRITYTPDSGFSGRDTFSYTISDGEKTATAHVTVTVRQIELPTPQPTPTPTPPPAAPSINVDGNGAEWRDIEALATATGQNITTLKASSDAENLYFLLEGNNMAANIQFHLNVDDDRATGYQTGIWNGSGIDYLLENGYLYRSGSNSRSWNWRAADHSAVVYKRSSSAIEVAIRKSALAGIGKTIKIGVLGLNSSWSVVAELPVAGRAMVTVDLTARQPTPDPAPRPTPTPPAASPSINVDGNGAEWRDIEALATAEGESLTSLKVSSNDENIYFLLEGNNMAANIQFHLNVDNDRATGYQTSDWNGSGIDYLLENGYLYRSGSNNRSWNWQAADHSAVIYKRSSSAIEVAIRKSALAGLKGRMKIAVRGLSRNWSVNSSIPKAENVMADFRE